MIANVYGFVCACVWETKWYTCLVVFLFVHSVIWRRTTFPFCFLFHTTFGIGYCIEILLLHVSIIHIDWSDLNQTFSYLQVAPFPLYPISIYRLVVTRQIRLVLAELFMLQFGFGIFFYSFLLAQNCNPCVFFCFTSLRIRN